MAFGSRHSEVVVASMILVEPIQLSAVFKEFLSGFTNLLSLLTRIDRSPARATNNTKSGKNNILLCGIT